MTRRLGSGDTERGRARLALVTIVLLTVAMILGVSPGSSLRSVLASVTGSPTGTETSSDDADPPATPAASAGPSIQLLNPSNYASPKVASNKTDTDGDYHLVAWVGNLAAVPNPVVDFEIKQGGVTQFTLTGTQVGSDTFEAKWSVSQSNGNYTVTATLYSGNTQVASDTESVTIRNNAETAEMTYPVNGGSLGVYDPPGADAPAGFVVDVTTSTNAREVLVLYGTAPPGTEQNWRLCSTQVTVYYSGGKDKRIGCTLGSGVTPDHITGVAVVTGGTVPFTPVPPNCTPPNQTNPPTCNSVDSGDAHRVTGYEQVPASVTVTPASSSPVINNCHELTAVILDNQSRPVWRANVDVHAVGPTDNLQFGMTTGTGTYQPPDQAGTHDSTEPTNDCGGEDTPPTQAEHNRPGPAPDEKHIESAPATDSGNGTDTSGAFVFALRSVSGGGTSVDVWFDGTDDDTKSNEASGTATVSWLGGTPTGSATGGTSSASATATATASRTASASASAGPASRSISMEPSRSTARFGKQVILSGVVESSNTGCESAQNVRIQRALIGGDFADFGTATTGSDGAYEFGFKPDQSATYRAIVDATSSCQQATSSDRAVLVRVKVGLKVSDFKVRRGDKVNLLATVKPCGNHSATDVVLLRRTRRNFNEIARKGLNGNCKATFRTKVKRTSAYKARWPSQDDNHEAGTSPQRVVEVRS